jgi:hypothetical protein
MLARVYACFSNTSISLRTPANGTLHYPYYESKISGDSGNPSFFVINNELVLLFTFTSGTVIIFACAEHARKAY